MLGWTPLEGLLDFTSCLLELRKQYIPPTPYIPEPPPLPTLKLAFHFPKWLPYAYCHAYQPEKLEEHLYDGRLPGFSWVPQPVLIRNDVFIVALAETAEESMLWSRLFSDFGMIRHFVDSVCRQGRASPARWHRLGRNFTRNFDEFQLAVGMFASGRILIGSARSLLASN